MARGRRDSWGSISYDPKARVGRIRFWANLDERGYMRHTVTVHGSRADVERRRAELLSEHSKDAPAPTCGTIWSRHVLPDMERRVDDGDMSPSTLAQYRKWWDTNAGPRWGDVPCDSVRPLAVQQWISSLGLSQAKMSVVVLRKVFDYAVRFEYSPSNPMRERYLMPSKSTVSEADKGVWTLQGLVSPWSKVADTWMEPAFILAAFGGCRAGESLGPMAGEVELREVSGVPVAVVPIVRQVDHTGKMVDRLKNRQSRRPIAIAGLAATRLAGIASRTDPSWPLTNDGFGRHVTQDRYTTNWRRMGMEHPFRNLRNSYQTWMRWQMKVPPYYIEPLMGHAERSVTGRYYDRPQADVFADVVAEAYSSLRYDEGWDRLILGEMGQSGRKPMA